MTTEWQLQTNRTLRNPHSLGTMLLSLPNELLLEILSFLVHPRSIPAFCRFAQASKACNEITSHFFLWETLANTIQELQGGQRISVDQLPKWWKENCPLCCGCGQPARCGSIISSFHYPPRTSARDLHTVTGKPTKAITSQHSCSPKRILFVNTVFSGAMTL